VSSLPKNETRNSRKSKTCALMLLTPMTTREILREGKRAIRETLRHHLLRTIGFHSFSIGVPVSARSFRTITEKPRSGQRKGQVAIEAELSYEESRVQTTEEEASVES